MESYVQINSICIDLANCTDKTDPGKCEHFSIRGYVSEIRKKDWKKCWPFPVDESDEQPSLPPLDVPKFRWWGCDKCRQATANEVIRGNDQTDVSHRNGRRSDYKCSNAVVSSDIQEAPVPNTTPVNGEIDLNKPIDLTCDTDCLPTRNEMENDAEVVQNRITDHDIGLEINLNHQVSGVPLPEVHPGHMEEFHINKIGCEVNVEKSSSEIYNEGTPTSEDNQAHNDLKRSCTILRDVTVVAEEDNVTDHPNVHLSPDSVDCDHVVPAANQDNIAKMDVLQDCNVERSTSLIRKRPRKMRLLRDLLNEKGEPKTDKTTMKGSSSYCPPNLSAASETPSIFRDKVDVQGDMTLTNQGHGRKRNFVVDEESRPADTCYQRVGNEIQNPEGVAKTVNTAGKRNKKFHHVDKDLISMPHQGQQRESEGTVDVANKEDQSESPSGFFPHASTEKAKDHFPLHILRKTNDCNSKGKGKMLQADEELDSLSCRKNDKLVEASFAHAGAKNMSSMPACSAVPSTKGTPNGEELVEGLHLSLKCYSSEQICNKQSIRQTEIRLPFSLPFQEGTSRSQLTSKDNEAGYFGDRRIPSNRMSNAVAVKGKGVHLEEINQARNKDKIVEVIELESPERCWELTAEDSDHDSEDDIPMEVVEIMARNQYERSLPDVENLSGPLEKSSQREKDQASDGQNGIIRRGGNTLPRKDNPSNYFSPLEANRFGMNNLGAIQFPFGFEVPQSKSKSSSGVHFSPIDTRQLGPPQTPIFNRSNAECSCSGATSQVKGGSNLSKTILQQDGKASQAWASLSKNNASLGYGNLPRKAVSKPTSNNIDLISLRSGSLHKQNNKRGIDLNCPNFNAIDLQKPTRTIGSGNMSRMNAEYTFPGKNNGMEPDQDPRDLYSNEAIPAMNLLSLMDAGREADTSSSVGVGAKVIKRPSYTVVCSTKLEKDTSKTHSSLKRRLSEHFSSSSSLDKSHNYFLDSPIFAASSSDPYGGKFRSRADFSDRNLSKYGKAEKMNSSNSAIQNGDNLKLWRPNIETQTPEQQRLDVSEPLQSISESSITLNRNPAEFTSPEEGNPYMIDGEDLKIEDSVPNRRPSLPAPRGHKKKNLKGSKMKEHERH